MSDPQHTHGAECHACETLYTLPEFEALPLVGRQDDGEGGALELRNCACGSTITIEVTL